MFKQAMYCSETTYLSYRLNNLLLTQKKFEYILNKSVKLA